MDTILDFIPCVMGLPAISKSLEKLLFAMQDFQGNSGLGVIQEWAKMIGLCIALGVGANECFQMILGRRGIDVMKLVHIVIISMCISFAGTIANMAAAPGKELENIAYALANDTNDQVKAQEAEVAKLQEQYIEKVREHLDKLQEHKDAEDAVREENLGQQIMDAITPDVIADGIQSVKNTIKEWTLLAETKVCEWISLIIRYIGEVLFQVSYYGLLVAQSIFMHILAAFAPLMFAISLSPHYKSAWSQWLSKYISVSLWGFVTYICLHYVDYIMLFNLGQDITAYQSFMSDLEKDVNGDVQIAAIGMQAVGSTCMYVVGLLVGVRVLAFVPEVASWLMPGGVSSGVGAASSSAGMSVVGAATGMALGTSAATAVAATGNISKSGAAYSKGRNFLKNI